MQNPERDISRVLSTLTSSRNDAEFREAVNKFYTRDASFHHPLAIVEHGEASRDRILAVHTWYRTVSPGTSSNLNQVLYHEEQNVLFAEVTQRFHIRISPFKIAPSRLIVRLEFRKDNGLHYIYSHENFFHPTDLMNYLLPPLTPVVRFALIFFACMADTCSTVSLWTSLMWVKLFGIGSDVQRGKMKPQVSSRNMQPEDQKTAEGTKSTQYGSA